MGSFDSQSPHALGDEQIERLAAIVVEDFGAALGRIQFHDIVLMMFEDIAGFEAMGRKLGQKLAASSRQAASQWSPDPSTMGSETQCDEKRGRSGAAEVV